MPGVLCYDGSAWTIRSTHFSVAFLYLNDTVFGRTFGPRCTGWVTFIVQTRYILSCKISNFLPSARHRPQDECDKELFFLEESLTKTCYRHIPFNCPTQAKNTIKHMSLYNWQDHLASTVLDKNRTPVFWAGFWPGGKDGIDTGEALADFITSVNGFQLTDTEWGQVAESKGANNLEACDWPRKEKWWNGASIKMAQAMALHKVPNIIIALHKSLYGKYSFYNTVLYRAELFNMGIEMRKISSWNPQFEVRSITVKGAPPGESGCALASEVKSRLEVHARRPVTVWCRPCTTLQSCGEKQQVEEKRMETTCIGNCQNGQGTLFWANGDVYEGQWKNHLRNGQGNMTWASGNMYQGEFKNDNHGWPGQLHLCRRRQVPR